MTKDERLLADGCADVEPVLFYGPKNVNGKGSNFSWHGLDLINPFNNQLTRYETGEHRYQAMKATSHESHEHVRNQFSPSEAKDAGRRVDLRPGWGSNYGDLCWYVMMEVIHAKTEQHSDVRKWLISTGDRPIYEDSPVDDIWGWRYVNDYRGKNLLGRCWMEVRKLYA